MGQGLPGAKCYGDSPWVLPIRARPGSQDPSHHPSQEQGSQGAPGQNQPWASGTSMGTEKGQGQDGTWAHGWAWLRGAHGWAGQGSKELETGPAALSLGQGLTGPAGLTWGLGPRQGQETGCEDFPCISS